MSRYFYFFSHGVYNAFSVLAFARFPAANSRPWLSMQRRWPRMTRSLRRLRGFGALRRSWWKKVKWVKTNIYII